MDEIIKDCLSIQKRVIKKYNLSRTQAEVLNRAIAEYDYEENDGIVFTDQFGIIDLFCSTEEETLPAPTASCIFALCEYIMRVAKYYSLGGRLNSNAGAYACEILEHSMIFRNGGN